MLSIKLRRGELLSLPSNEKRNINKGVFPRTDKVQTMVCEYDVSIVIDTTSYREGFFRKTWEKTLAIIDGRKLFPLYAGPFLIGRMQFANPVYQSDIVRLPIREGTRDFPRTKVREIRHFPEKKLGEKEPYSLLELIAQSASAEETSLFIQMLDTFCDKTAQTECVTAFEKRYRRERKN